MKNLTRSVMLALTLLLVLGLVGTSYAQDDLCFGLDEEDCDLYYGLSENPEFPLSSAFELDIEIEAVTDMPDSEEEFAMALFLSGAYVIDADAMEDAVNEFNDTPVLDVSAGTFLDLGRGIIGGFDAELELDYEFPPEMGIPPLGPFNAWIVDGVGYVDFTPFAAFGDDIPEGIMGIDLFDLIEVPLQQVAIGDLLEGFEGMGDVLSDPFALGDGFGVTDTSQDNPLANLGVADLSIEDIESFVSVERADDDTVDGVDVVVFVTSIDIEAAMEVDAVVAAAYQSAVQGGLSADIDEADFGEALAEALAGSAMTITEKIDPETGIGMQVTIEAEILIDAEPLSALMGEQEEGTISVNVVTDFVRSDVNNVDEIELPEDAQVIPVEALLGGF